MLNHHTAQTWVVVADACQAKVYQVVKFPKIQEISSFEHPESRLHNRELVECKPGSSVTRGGGIRYSYQPELEPKQMEADKFAAEIAQMLSKSKSERCFERLYIIASPAFLGMLRRHLSPQVRKTIIAELAKELSHSNTADIEHHLYEL